MWFAFDNIIICSFHLTNSKIISKCISTISYLGRTIPDCVWDMYINANNTERNDSKKNVLQALQSRIHPISNLYLWFLYSYNMTTCYIIILRFIAFWKHVVIDPVLKSPYFHEYIVFSEAEKYTVYNNRMPAYFMTRFELLLIHTTFITILIALMSCLYHIWIM